MPPRIGGRPDGGSHRLAHNRHYVRFLTPLSAAHKCRYVRALNRIWYYSRVALFTSSERLPKGNQIMPTARPTTEEATEAWSEEIVRQKEVYNLAFIHLLEERTK